MMMMNTCVQTYYTLRLLHTNIQRFSKVKSETDEMESVLTGSNYVIKFNHWLHNFLFYLSFFLFKVDFDQDGFKSFSSFKKKKNLC